jgi:hypothetical protein
MRFAHLTPEISLDTIERTLREEISESNESIIKKEKSERLLVV